MIKKEEPRNIAIKKDIVSQNMDKYNRSSTLWVFEIMLDSQSKNYRTVWYGSKNICKDITHLTRKQGIINISKIHILKQRSMDMKKVKVLSSVSSEF